MAAASFTNIVMLNPLQIILSIFSDRARTKEAMLQVELARLPYMRARLVRGTEAGLDRQQGGVGVMGGSGETELESARRRLDHRESSLRHKVFCDVLSCLLAWVNRGCCRSHSHPPGS